MQDGPRPSTADSTLGPLLALVGVAGLAVTIVLALVALSGSVTATTLASAVYGAGVVGMIVVTAGSALPPARLWALRLALPLSGAALVFFVVLALS